MSGCSCFDRITLIDPSSLGSMEFKSPSSSVVPPQSQMSIAQPQKRLPPNLSANAVLNPGGPGPGGTSSGANNPPPQPPPNLLPPPPPVVPNPLQTNNMEEASPPPALLERDYYGCYCLKFIVKNGTHITEEKVQEDFGKFGEVVDVRGPGLFSGLRGNHVYVRFIDQSDAEEALRQLSSRYHQLTPASISDVLPDNYGLYTISFYNKTGIPSSEVRKEFSKFGEVKNLTGSLDVKGGRVFVSYKEKASAVQALQAFFFRKDRYPNMKFALPRCEKDYFGCYCLKFYNKSGDVTEDKVMKDFGQFGDVVDVRGPGLFDVTGDDVYVRYKEKSSAEQALIELVGRYDSLCLAPPSDIQADKFGYFTITFVNDKCLSKSDVWYIFSKFGTVACVNGTFDCKKGRVFVSYKDKQGALDALETMLITKEYHLQVSKNSTVRKNDYNVVGGNGGKECDMNEDQMMINLNCKPPPSLPSSSSMSNNNSSSNMSSSALGSNSNSSQQPPPPLQHQTVPSLAAVANSSVMQQQQHHHHQQQLQQQNNQQQQQQQQKLSSHSNIPNLAESDTSVPPPSVIPPPNVAGPPPQSRHVRSGSSGSRSRESSLVAGNPSHAQLQHHQQQHQQQQQQQQQQQHNGGGRNGLVKFNRNVEKDIFGYYCLSFLNEDGDINEKKVRFDFGKFGEVVSVRGALGKQKGHVFVRFRKKEAAENCLNCLNSFPLSEMSELFGKYLFLSPATPRDIDCDMYNLYSISFLNLNFKNYREIRNEFQKFGEIIRLTSGGGGNTDELVSISYSEKQAAVKALQTHFTNKEFPYLDIAKGSSLLLVNSSDSSDNEDNESDYIHHHHRELQQQRSSVPPPPIGNKPPPPVGSGPPPPQPSQQQQHHQQQHQQQQQQPVSKQQLLLQQMPPSTIAPNDPFHDPTPIKNGFGGDVVDELLKPLQSYLNIYRTGQYQSPLGDLANSGSSIPVDVSSSPSSQQSNSTNNPSQPSSNYINGQQQQQQQQIQSNSSPTNRSPDKKYRIKMNSNRPPISNGGPMMATKPPPPPMSGMGGAHRPNFSVPPPSSTVTKTTPPPPLIPNGIPSHQQQQQQQQQLLHQQPPPQVVSNHHSNSLVHEQHHHHQQQPQQLSPHHHHVMHPDQHQLHQQPPPPVNSATPSSSSSANTPSSIVSSASSTAISSKNSSVKSSPERDYNSERAQLLKQKQQQQQHMNGVLVDEVREKSSSPGEDAKTELQQTKPPATNDKSPAAASTPVIEDGKEEVDIEEEDVNNSQEPITVEPDILGFYTLSFCNKSKDLSERKIRLDFANVEGLNQGSVLRVRGLAGLSKNEIGSGETINVSFVTQEAAETAANAPAIREKYSRLRCAPAVSLVPNKEGHFSVDFINSGMSGMREITTEFSKFGEVAKVMAGGGAKNAVKKVTVSFGSKESAFNAVKAQGNSKDFVSCDFSKDCIA